MKRSLLEQGIRDVTRDRRDAHDRSVSRADRRYGERDGDPFSVLADARRDQLGCLAAPGALENRLELLAPLRRNQERDRTTDHLRRRVAVDPLRTGVPA